MVVGSELWYIFLEYVKANPTASWSDWIKSRQDLIIQFNKKDLSC